MFLKKEKDPTPKQVDDDEWIRSLTEAQEITVDVPEDSVIKKSSSFKWANSSGNTSRRRVAVVDLDPKAALRLSPSSTSSFTTSGPQDHRPNRLPESKLTKKWFGMIEWKAVREAASRFLLQHTAAAGWKHRNLSHVEQEELSPMPKDCGTEQGSLALGMVAAATRGRVAVQQVSGSLPWAGVDDPSDIQRLQAEHAIRMQKISNFQLGGHEKLTGADDPRHALQQHGEEGFGGLVVRG